MKRGWQMAEGGFRKHPSCYTSSVQADSHESAEAFSPRVVSDFRHPPSAIR